MDKEKMYSFLLDSLGELGSLNSILEEEKNLLKTIEALNEIIMYSETRINSRVDPSVYKELDIRTLHLETIRIKKVLIALTQKGNLC